MNLASLIGRPWHPNACGPVAYDCRGLVAHVLEHHFALPVPPLLRAEAAAAAPLLGAEVAAGWRPVAAGPQAGDVLVVRGRAGAHVGVFVHYGSLGVLHSVEPPAAAAGVRFDRLDNLLAAGFARPTVWRHCAQ